MIFNMSEEEWDAVIAVHLHGCFNTIRPASQLMRQQRSGRIINFSSESGLWGNAGQANYGAAKSGIAGLTRVVARDLGRYGVTCNAIAPRAWTRLTATIPDQRPGQQAEGSTEERLAALDPDMIAPFVCYLATDDAAYINGQAFHVYAGVVAVLHHPTPKHTIFKHGMWTLDELTEALPAILEGTKNPAPPRDDIDVPGRDAQAAKA
jgi:NAD(P)-dependent dehydrogenase (short-subunit alcohol dehydrogenase family)